MPVVDVNGLSIHHELHGDPDGPPILVISGTGGDLRVSFPDRSPLNRAGHTCHYDQRGLGRTSKPEGPYTMAQYADDAAGLVAALGWSRCHVVGTSFGGMVALNLVVRHPHLVDRLVLNCTSPGGDWPSYPLHELTALSPEERFLASMRINDTRFDPDADEPIPGLSRAAYDAYAAGSAVERTGDSLRGYLAQLEARRHHDVDAALPSITAPTLVCAGRHDRIAPIENSERLAERIPGARFETFEGGHLFLLQDRAAFVTIVDFLGATA